MVTASPILFRPNDLEKRLLSHGIFLTHTKDTVEVRPLAKTLHLIDLFKCIPQTGPKVRHSPNSQHKEPLQTVDGKWDGAARCWLMALCSDIAIVGLISHPGPQRRDEHLHKHLHGCQRPRRMAAVCISLRSRPSNMPHCQGSKSTLTPELARTPDNLQIYAGRSRRGRGDCRLNFGLIANPHTWDIV